MFSFISKLFSKKKDERKIDEKDIFTTNMCRYCNKSLTGYKTKTKKGTTIFRCLKCNAFIKKPYGMFK